MVLSPKNQIIVPEEEASVWGTITQIHCWNV